MEKEIYIIRHGETDFNRLGIVQGRGVNSDLNPKGIAQGEAFYEYYKHIPFDKVYTSSLKRTHQTVKKFIDSNLPWEQLDGLDELSFGVWEGADNKGDWQTAFADVNACWLKGECDRAFENGESPNQAALRLKAAMDTIVANTEEKTVLVCMHGRALLILLCLLYETPLSQMSTYGHQNTGLYRVQYANGKYKVLQVNDAAHLAALSVV
ncbi:histidine phosphatase family protein [Chitinophaga horti]|uniref:Histidine phosphatase family protein n=1 Tax=Chitinophaga horti TaxID=2920382 RepID=A0ABY6J855_9BACT|nr:histidine phosphatase family protein [Chitinophaga horti]UYQ94469.1 histidine phosphatase family protein [Chitinophaga horti]